METEFASETGQPVSTKMKKTCTSIMGVPSGVDDHTFEINTHIYWYLIPLTLYSPQTGGHSCLKQNSNTNENRE